MLGFASDSLLFNTRTRNDAATRGHKYLNDSALIKFVIAATIKQARWCPPEEEGERSQRARRHRGPRTGERRARCLPAPCRGRTEAPETPGLRRNVGCSPAIPCRGRPGNSPPLLPVPGHVSGDRPPGPRDTECRPWAGAASAVSPVVCWFIKNLILPLS